MIEVHVNQDIALPHGFSEYVIESERDLDLTFSGSGKCQAFIRIRKCPSLRIRIFTDAGADISYLFWNDSDTPVTADESHEVMADASLKIAYGECNHAETKRNVWVALRQNGAYALVSSATLAEDKKNTRMEVVNYAPHTVGEMKNFAVVLKGGNFFIDAIGKIVKGAYASQSHQTSRALCFEEGQNSEIIPELLIDENDVQASHAMSIGRMDDEQLYYLQSRGLSMRQSIMLMSTGYLMPITEFIDDEGLKERLKNEMEEKIARL